MHRIRQYASQLCILEPVWLTRECSSKIYEQKQPSNGKHFSQSIQQSSAPAMGSRISNPSRTTRATLSPDDDDDEGSSAEEETDTCTKASFLDLLVGDGPLKISTWPPGFVHLPE